MFRDGWTDEDERSYERVRRSELELGKSEELAEEIAIRTVQLQRRAEGRTAGRAGAGTGPVAARAETTA